MRKMFPERQRVLHPAGSKASEDENQNAGKLGENRNTGSLRKEFDESYLISISKHFIDTTTWKIVRRKLIKCYVMHILARLLRVKT